jgi:hypothetical protein
MTITNLHSIPEIENNKNLKENYLQFQQLLVELKKQELTDAIVNSINRDISQINSLKGSGKELNKIIKTKQDEILNLLEKELKIVPKKHYRKLWLVLGMAVIGVPLGVVFGVILENMAFLSIGLPLGMAIGITVGARMDKKALEDGRQIDIEF